VVAVHNPKNKLDIRSIKGIVTPSKKILHQELRLIEAKEMKMKKSWGALCK
jgi:hypothetical protein